MYCLGNCKTYFKTACGTTSTTTTEVTTTTTTTTTTVATTTLDGGVLLGLSLGLLVLILVYSHHHRGTATPEIMEVVPPTDGYPRYPPEPTTGCLVE